MRRKRLWTFGARPHTVSVFEETLRDVRLVRAQWKLEGRRVTKSWPASAAARKEARAFAEELANELAAPAKAASDPSLRQLWDAFVAGEFDALRPKTVVNYVRHWRAWETFADRDTPASSIRLETLDRFRQALKARGMALSQIRKHIGFVKQVYRFGVERELVPPPRFLDYRVRAPKEDRSPETVEYLPDDARKIIAQLDPERSTQWRGWVYCTIAHYLGKRDNAIRHLDWADYDEGAQTLTWRARWDKMGKERTQALPAQVVVALAVARVWRERDGYTGTWIFYTPRREWKGDRPMTYGAVNWMLRRAEKGAGVAHVHRNAAHRFKRGAVGNVTDLTGGDVVRALQWVGNDDPKMAALYLKRRASRDQGVADLLSAQHEPAATEVQSDPEGIRDTPR